MSRTEAESAIIVRCNRKEEVQVKCNRTSLNNALSFRWPVKPTSRRCWLATWSNPQCPLPNQFTLLSHMSVLMAGLYWRPSASTFTNSSQSKFVTALQQPQVYRDHRLTNTKTRLLECLHKEQLDRVESKDFKCQSTTKTNRRSWKEFLEVKV